MNVLSKISSIDTQGEWSNAMPDSLKKLQAIFGLRSKEGLQFVMFIFIVFIFRMYGPQSNQSQTQYEKLITMLMSIFIERD